MIFAWLLSAFFTVLLAFAIFAFQVHRLFGRMREGGKRAVAAEQRALARDSPRASQDSDETLRP